MTRQGNFSQASSSDLTKLRGFHASCFFGFSPERERLSLFFLAQHTEKFPRLSSSFSLSIYICSSISVLPPSASLLSGSGRRRKRERERERDLGRMRPPPPPPPFSGLHPVCPHSLSRSRHGRFCSARVYTPSLKEEVLQTLPSSAQYLVRKEKKENSLLKEALTLPFYGTLQNTTTYSARKIGRQGGK